MDHPRSRGGYPRGSWREHRRPGSSPLARGLQGIAAKPINFIRIIPARAGFTPTGRMTAWSPPDHPRSRGVYAVNAAKNAQAAGSSPLARGLREEPTDSAPHRGIIPARAGFTRRRLARGPRRWDHPRSRGVYFGLEEDSALVDGSSPLARGLHQGRALAPVHSGIIPARAGFTSKRIAVSSTSWDHPRSRGVYFFAALTAPSMDGSSPLARGLRPPGHPGDALHRIIPARAGFTR